MKKKIMLFIIIAAVLTLCGTTIAAETHSSGEVIIASAHPADVQHPKGQSPKGQGPEGTEGESPEMVYEATQHLHTTGSPQDVNISTWRLEVNGEKTRNPISLSYQDLKTMNMMEKDVTLVCPGFFTDQAVWEGVLLSDILEQAQVQEDYEKIVFHSLDGYRSTLNREDIENHLVFLALKVNGVTLPKEHGYPLRLVAEDITGGRWVKWIDSIEVQ
jgi:DMSO/TMAO reductase YedYZ molybdopterin-dependent catalytic subunit